MTIVMRRLGCFAAVVLAALVLSNGANAAATVRVGTLVCDVEGGAGFIVGSRKVLSCDFNRLGGGPEFYDGSITKIGIDAGLTAGTRLVWFVFAPSLQLERGALEGRYFGLTAEATPVVGLGANVLIGGFDRSINLQPISVQGQLGLNIAAGIAGMRLKGEPELPIVRKR